MSTLTAENKTIYSLLSSKGTSFLIPDYQRPYSWGIQECEALWDDLYSYAIPEGNIDNYSDDHGYFLGTIIVYKNNNRLEIIDGQQRLTSLYLLLRALYDKFFGMLDEKSTSTREMIGKCLWQTDMYDRAQIGQIRLDSEVATDESRDEFKSIVNTGKTVEDCVSNYTRNFLFFKQQVDRTASEQPSYLAPLAARILLSVNLLPIEADSQDTALRIFSTLNDRGMPLSDSDIFKSQLYRYYSSLGRKDEFISRWKDLERDANLVFSPRKGTPLDELFAKYMYFIRAKNGITGNQTCGLRDFYSQNNYKLLHEDNCLDDLESLIGFWKQIYSQEDFSDRVLNRLFVLKYSTNNVWTYILSVWFMVNRDDDNKVSENDLYQFLNILTAFLLTCSLAKEPIGSVRSMMLREILNIVQHRPLTFSNYKLKTSQFKTNCKPGNFSNARPITKFVLAWWAFEDPYQRVLPIDTALEIEHIYSVRRNKIRPLRSRGLLDSLGNKSLIEKRINIRASDYNFSDKRLCYQGMTEGSNTIVKEPTQIRDLYTLAVNNADFTENQIVQRNNKIHQALQSYLEKYGFISKR